VEDVDHDAHDLPIGGFDRHVRPRRDARSRKYNTLSEKIFYQARLDLIKKTGILEYKECKVGINEMGGNDAFKDWVADIMDSFTPEAEEFGVVKPKGYLGVGVPGTSKTMSAEIMATELNLPLLKFNMSSVMHSHVGQSEKNMDNALKIVKACSPCVLLIDEIEKTLSGTASSNGSDGGTLMRVVGQLLEYLGSDDSKDTFTIMTSNNASALPPELTRSGRIDTTWYFGLPTEPEREEIFKIHLGKTNIALEKGLIEHAASKENTLNFTGAEIKEIVKVAVRKAFKGYKETGNKLITKADIDAAIQEVVPVYESSKEKIAVLEEYYRTRARFSNTKPVDDEPISASEENNEDIDFNFDV
jgi:SpoVK/Ycf46/Vps4 family AAA+-type ATPase